MKLLLLTAVLGAVAMMASCKPEPKGPATTAYPPEFGPLLAKYVTPQGVKYGDWHKNAEDMEALRKVVGFYATYAPPTDPMTSLAWHINAYNAWILERMLAQYPTDGPLSEDPKFFDKKQITVSGETISLNDLESGIIRPTFQEPRIHFAVNCASVSCPPLAIKPYDPKTLDADLTAYTKKYLNSNPEGVSIKPDGSFAVSQIFEWYAKDFGGAEKVVEFINSYRDEPLPATSSPAFLTYNWALNESR